MRLIASPVRRRRVGFKTLSEKCAARICSLWKPVMRYWKSILISLALTLPLAASAHEFWMRAEPFSPRVGSTAQLFMFVGQYFEGEQVGYVTSHSAMLRHYFAGQVEDLIGLVPADKPIGQVPVAITRAGTHLIAFDSFPSAITIEAGKFDAYLHDEGLDQIVTLRQQQGKSALPGRERFRRITKTLLRAGGIADRTYALRTGQRLELVPLIDPTATVAGRPLRFKLFFDDKPLAGALLRAWHHHDNQTISIRAISGADGIVNFTLPYSGSWMISTVHMIAAVDSADIDWDSFWGNLMFEVPAK